MIDDYEICGGGIILEDLPDSEKWVRDITLVRNFKWIKSLITPEERAEHYNQRACLILITGESGAGRKRDRQPVGDQPVQQRQNWSIIWALAA